MSEATPSASSGWIMVAIRPAGRRVVVVGSGPVARRRAELFLSRGAMVEIFDPNMAGGTSLPDGATSRPREINRDDLEGAWLIIVATNDPDVNDRIGRWADELGVACNRADDAEEGNLAVPAMMDSELGWKLGILGGDAGPLFSVWLKSQVAKLTDSEQVKRVYSALAEARQKMDDSGTPQAERAEKLREVMWQVLQTTNSGDAGA